MPNADQVQSTGRRRSRRSRNLAGIKSPAFARGIFVAMLALSIALVGYTAFKMRQAASLYSLMAPGMTESEVRYLFGTPSRQSADQRDWIYAEGGGAATRVRFNGSKQVVSIACSGIDGQIFGCPATYGIELGVSEDRLINRLGPPSSFRYIPDGKLLNYADLGLIFTMRRYQVTGISKVSKDGRLGYLPRVLWSVLP